ncbi:substrate-binding domain-containing protein [Natranaerofaba carboxydovora]|uniref:substrate-binding domain-containing protein n=1 Tax=Natranaerofaba carboxydovora TaxID=2742683 RepID=UPI001F133BC9|nr:substrate-binding domain-containing protein [Natranaerofaba carboxydovora]UMZ75478.1 Tungstate-binding protein TupA [Natranaerofaba carboxydovora]
MYKLVNNKKTKLCNFLLLFFLLSFILTGCSSGSDNPRLRLATTTSTEDSGLLDELLPIFEDETGYNVEVIAVGTGQALEAGRRGDADVIFVHAKELEKEFVADGYGKKRYQVKYNDFVILGPEDDPLGIKNINNLEDAMKSIYKETEDGDTVFVSRGDGSGTHQAELSLWEEFDLNVDDKEWYNSLGQGMGDTLITANEMKGYVLADRGTYLSMRENLNNLEVVFEGSEKLKNSYGMIPINPEEFSNVDYDGAHSLAEFFVREDIQDRISEFGVDTYGEPLFFPDAD